jgi:thiamine transport system substrate-binding protein
VVTGGDSGAVVSRAILTAGNPEGDVLWGVDNTAVARAVRARLFDTYEPVDEGDVCVNYSKKWYAARNLQPPAGLDDLVKPQYAGQLVVQDPVNSSPGLAFLLASVARYGGGWQDWWRKLKDNGVHVAADWTTAWTMDYAGAGNPGRYPMVVSYGSSPPAEIVYAADPASVTEPDSGVIESTCFRQTEYVGVLRGTRNPNLARRLVEYLLDVPFQESMPTSLFVFPVNPDAKLPDVFAKWAVRAAQPLTIGAAEIGANLARWLDEWRAAAL